MWSELIGLVVLGFAIYGAFCLTKNLFRPTQQVVRQPPPPPRPLDQSLQRPPQPTYSPAVRKQYRELQVALMQARDAPDFRRAASYAAQAREVPVAFRQQQYRRFRPLLVARFTERLQSGVGTDALLPGLHQLVAALGFAEFEADYVRLEAESQIRRHEPARRDFGQVLREAQANFRDRVRVLEEMSDLDEEVREQLVEQERMRFQERMRELSAQEGSGHGR